MTSELIYGRQPVLEALRASRPLRKILVSRNTRPSGAVRAILDHARQQDIAVQFVDQRRLDELVSGHHQGVIAMASAKSLVSIEHILDVARGSGTPPLLLVLDGIEDPANLGAILRTADAAGVHGVVIPKHRAVGLTGAVARTSAGAVEFVPVAQVTNVTRTLDELKAAGLWVVGADPKVTQNLYEVDLTPALVLVIGGEGKGLGRLVREHCDLLVRLPMRGSVSSLNVAVATGIFLFEILRQRETRPSAG